MPTSWCIETNAAAQLIDGGCHENDLASVISGVPGVHPQEVHSRELVLEGAVDVSPAAEEATHGEIIAWCLVGMSGWWSLNMITAELPYFVEELPEKQRLGNLLAVCTQLGNLAPFVYTAVSRRRHVNLVNVILVGQLVATAVLLFCAFGWRTSMLLFIATVVAGNVGCLSSVTYWAAAADRPASCVRAMSVGTTFGGLLATGLSGLQLAGCNRDEARFAPSIFFVIAAFLQFLQGGAFFARSRAMRKQQEELVAADGKVAAGQRNHEGGHERAPMPKAGQFLVAGLFVIYAMTYTMPTLQPYMAQAYSDPTERQQLLLWIQILQNAGDVIGRLSSVFVNGKNLGVLSVWLVMLTGTFLVSIFAAADNQNLQDMLSYSLAKFVLPGVCGWFYFSRGLLVTTFYVFAKGLGPDHLVQTVTVNMGLFGQIGALAANAVAFAVVNFAII